MSEYQSLSHSKRDCKYHIVFIPKRRRKAIYGNIRKKLGPIFHDLAEQKQCHIIEGPSHGGSRAYLHENSTKTCRIERNRIPEREERDCDREAILRKDKNFMGEHFWARGYAVSTVGFELEAVKKYIREQEVSDEQGQF